MDRVEYQPLVIQDLLGLYTRDELDLNPWYQRRSVWTTPQKAYLINTILAQKPVPSLYIRHTLDMEHERSIKEVVDGQQRVRSIIEYVDDGFSASHPDIDKKVKYSQLSRNQKEAFRMTSLSVGYLMGATDADVIDVFGRLNSVSKTLNLQEKRNARFSGEFKQFCLQEAARRVKFWRDYGIFTANDISRMEEVQFVSEIVINILYGLSDYSASGIDQAYQEFDEAFSKRKVLSDRLERVFRQIVSLDVSAIRDTVFARSPIFFSLFLILNDPPRKLSMAQLQDRLYSIDKAFNSDVAPTSRPKEDASFYLACTSNMHRIKSRRVRDTYIRKRLGK